MPDGSLMAFEAYQTEYGLTGNQIAKYFSFTESRFIKDLEDYDELIVCHLLMRVLDEYRKLKNAVVNINSFNRNDAKQESLHNRGFKTAKVSPHVEKLAGDCDTTTEAETKLNVSMIKVAAKNLGIKVRIGFQQYLDAGQTFIHVDVCPEYYGVGKVWHAKKHPIQWENELTW